MNLFFTGFSLTFTHEFSVFTFSYIHLIIILLVVQPISFFSVYFFVYLHKFFQCLISILSMVLPRFYLVRMLSMMRDIPCKFYSIKFSFKGQWFLNKEKILFLQIFLLELIKKDHSFLRSLILQIKLNWIKIYYHLISASNNFHAQEHKKQVYLIPILFFNAIF